MQGYLIESPLTTQQKQMLFQMRTLTYPVFANIPFLVKDTRCPCCLLQEDTMEHNLRCFVIQANTQIMSCRATNIAISDIFSSEVEKQAKLTVLFDQAIRRRKIILQHINSNQNLYFKIMYQPSDLYRSATHIYLFVELEYIHLFIYYIPNPLLRC